MATQQSPAEILRDHVTLEVEYIDRMYLNLFVPQLQMEGAAASFFLKHRKQTRYFGRWILPIFPIVCLLGAFFLVDVAVWLGRRMPAGGRGWSVARMALAALLVIAVLAQGLRAHVVVMVAAYLVLVFLIYTFCELLPKTLFRSLPNRLTLLLAGPFQYIHAVLSPLGGDRFYAVFTDPEFSKAVFPFKTDNGKVTGVTVKVADFVEYTPYEFVKQ